MLDSYAEYSQIMQQSCTGCQAYEQGAENKTCQPANTKLNGSYKSITKLDEETKTIQKVIWEGDYLKDKNFDKILPIQITCHRGSKHLRHRLN